MSDDDTKSWIYAGGIPYELTEGDIVCVFSQYGEILEISLSRDRETGKSRGFCFLKYEDPRSCELAVDNLNGAAIVGRKIKVSFANNVNALKAKKPAIVAPTEIKMLPAIEPNKEEFEHKHSDKRQQNSPSPSPSSRRHKRSKHSHRESREKRHKSRHRDSPSTRRHKSSKRSHKDSKGERHKSKHHSHTRSPRRKSMKHRRHHSKRE